MTAAEAVATAAAVAEHQKPEEEKWKWCIKPHTENTCKWWHMNWKQWFRFIASFQRSSGVVHHDGVCSLIFGCVQNFHWTSLTALAKWYTSRLRIRACVHIHSDAHGASALSLSVHTHFYPKNSATRRISRHLFRRPAIASNPMNVPNCFFASKNTKRVHFRFDPQKRWNSKAKINDRILYFALDCVFLSKCVAFAWLFTFCFVSCFFQCKRARAQTHKVSSTPKRRKIHKIHAGTDKNPILYTRAFRSAFIL